MTGAANSGGATRVGTVVVGAGISGLAYAHYRGADADLVVLEAADAPGGLIRTESFGRDGAFHCETGPEALMSTSGASRELLADLGIEERQVPPSARNRYLAHRGRLVIAPLAPKQLLSTPMLSLGAKLRVLTERWRDAKKARDGSIAGFVRHRFGPEVVEALADPVISGIHAGDVDVLSLRACFPQVDAMLDEHGSLFAALAARRGQPKPSLIKPAGGCGAVTDALAARLGDRLRLASPAESIERAGDRFRVVGPSETFEAETVVLATSFARAADLLRPLAPAAAEPLATMPAESLVAFVHAHESERVAHPLDGFGYLVPRREGLAHLGTLFSSSIDGEACPPGYVQLRTLLGGARHPEAIDLDDDDLESLVRSEVHPLLGIQGSASEVRVHRWRDALPRYDLQHTQRIETARAEAPPGVVFLGNHVEGVGVNSLLPSAKQAADQMQSPPA